MGLHPVRSFQHFLGNVQGGAYQPGRDPRERQGFNLGKANQMGNRAIQGMLPPDSTLGLLAFALTGGFPEGALGREAALGRGVGRPIPKALPMIGHGLQAPHRVEYDALRRGQKVAGWEGRLAHEQRGSIDPGFAGHPGIKIGGPQTPGVSAGRPSTGRRVVKASSIPEKNPPPEGYAPFGRPNMDKLMGQAMFEAVHGKGAITNKTLALRTAGAAAGATALVGGAGGMGHLMDVGAARQRRARDLRDRQQHGMH